MKIFRFAPLLPVAMTALVVAQTATPGNSGQRGGRFQVPPNARSVIHNGRPAFELLSNDGWGEYVILGPHQGEPALGFAVAQGDCQGMVYVTRTRVSGDFRGTKCQNFDVPRASSTAERKAGIVTVTSGSSKYDLVQQVERDNQRQPLGTRRGGGELLPRAINNFDGIFRNIHRIAAEAQTRNASQPSTPAADKSTTTAARTVGVLTINSDPGDVQVYVNDEPKGLTSAEGREVLRLPPGTYRVRLSLPGYKDFEQQVVLAAGKDQQLKAQLETAGPPPFKESDVAEMLQGKMSPKRISTLVQERGVDFDVSPDIEKRFRSMGATSDLLLVVATNKKK